MSFATRSGTLPWTKGPRHLEPLNTKDTTPRAASRKVQYECASGHSTNLTFALEAQAPITWECRWCDRVANLVDAGAGPTFAPEERAVRPKRTHLDMVRERRTDAELEALLNERLTLLRQRRSAA